MPSGDQLLGRRLLAHELAHAVQHRGHPGATALPIDDADSPAEREASAAADAVASGGAVSSINAMAVPMASRWTDEELGFRSEQAGEQDDRTWWEDFFQQTREAARDTLNLNIGRVEGVALEAGNIVDILVWLPYAQLDLVDAVLDKAVADGDMSPSAVDAIRASFEVLATPGAVPLMPPLPSPELLRQLRDACAAAGLTDPVTGAPTISPVITGSADWLESHLVEPLFSDLPPEQGLLTSRDVGQLQGAIGAQLALALAGGEEVQLGLKVVASAGALKAIVTTMQANPSGWLHDSAFWLQVVNAGLFLAGIGASTAGKKIATILVDSASVVLSVTPAVAKLATDWKEAKDPGREAVLNDDLKAVIRVVAQAAQQVILDARALKASTPKPPAGEQAPTPTSTQPAASAQPETSAMPVPDAEPVTADRPAAPVVEHLRTSPEGTTLSEDKSRAPASVPTGPAVPAPVAAVPARGSPGAVEVAAGGAAPSVAAPGGRPEGASVAGRRLPAPAGEEPGPEQGGLVPESDPAAPASEPETIPLAEEQPQAVSQAPATAATPETPESQPLPTGSPESVPAGGDTADSAPAAAPASPSTTGSVATARQKALLDAIAETEAKLAEARQPFSRYEELRMAQVRAAEAHKRAEVSMAGLDQSSPEFAQWQAAKNDAWSRFLQAKEDMRQFIEANPAFEAPGGERTYRDELEEQLEVLRRELNPPARPPVDTSLPLGGKYGAIPAQYGEVNHIPPRKAIYPWITDSQGPAIRMETADHRLAKSTTSAEWRETQATLVSQGKFLEAVKMDLDDIRSQPWGPLYEAGIDEMLIYITTMPQFAHVNRNSALQVSDLRAVTSPAPVPAAKL
jgi:hypothetical protein